MSDEKLWKVFSLFIRLRDTDSKGFGKCITCPRIIFYRDGDCGHGIGRQHKATKFDEKNNALQCKPCNGFEGGRREDFRKAINKRFGSQTWDLLEMKARSVYKWSQFEFDALQKYYQCLVNKLLYEKGLK